MRLGMAPLTWAQTNCSTSSPPSISFPNWPSTMSPILGDFKVYLCCGNCSKFWLFFYPDDRYISDFVVRGMKSGLSSCWAVRRRKWGIRGRAFTSLPGTQTVYCVLWYTLCSVYCDTDCVLVRLHLSAAHSPTLICSLILKCTEHKSAEHHWALEQ